MTVQGNLNAQGLSFALVVSRFNETISRRLLDGARDCLIRHGCDEKNIAVYFCPGAFEVPQVARKLSQTGTFGAVIALGAVIRGETPHFDYIAAEAAKGIAQVGMNGSIPVVFGVLTTDTTEQAFERSGGKVGNKGWDAALSAIEMIRLYEQIK
jgi:6,7-dimethyl-8-ribityllumazine synthase